MFLLLKSILFFLFWRKKLCKHNCLLNIDEALAHTHQNTKTNLKHLTILEKIPQLIIMLANEINNSI